MPLHALTPRVLPRPTQAKIREIPALLPDVLNAVRMIWSISRHYNTKERIVGLLRKVSNSIISRCTAQIEIEKIWSGEVLQVKESLHESIAAGRAWGNLFKAVANQARVFAIHTIVSTMTCMVVRRHPSAFCSSGCMQTCPVNTPALHARTGRQDGPPLGLRTGFP